MRGASCDNTPAGLNAAHGGDLHREEGRGRVGVGVGCRCGDASEGIATVRAG